MVFTHFHENPVAWPRARRKLMAPIYRLSPFWGAILVLGVFVGTRANGRAEWYPPRKDATFPAPPRSAAEYHFNLAQAYEYRGALGKAHLHYEIIHDSYCGSTQYAEATRRMLVLRSKPRSCGFGVWSSGGRQIDFNPDTQTPSMNPKTFLRLDTIWPAAKKQYTYESLNDL